MSLNVYYSNNSEQLFRNCLAQKMFTGQKDPFCPETIVVRTPIAAAWLRQHLASHFGIAANLNIITYSKFKTELIQHLTKDNLSEKYLKNEVLFWRIINEFLHNIKNYEEVEKYIGASDNGFKLVQISSKLSTLFNSYQEILPEMISEWNDELNTNKNEWQAELWANVQKDCITKYALLTDHSSIKKAENFYKKINFFQPNKFEPLFINFLNELSEIVEINIFQTVPFSDVNSFNSFTESLGCNYSHQIFESFGNEIKKFMLKMIEKKAKVKDISFLEYDKSNMLGNIQESMTSFKYFDCEMLSSNKINKNFMLSCNHNMSRELESIYDYILSLIEKDKDIQPRDIVVLTPDINQYVPYIKAVFESRNMEHSAKNPPFSLPYSIYTQLDSESSETAGIFFKIIDIASTKYKNSEMFNILESATVMEKFEISENDLQCIRKWIYETGIRWGIDGEHRLNECGLYFTENSIQQGIEKILLGYSSEADYEAEGIEIPSYGEIEISESEIAGKFIKFLNKLIDVKMILSSEKTTLEWKNSLMEILNSFFGQSESEQLKTSNIRMALISLYNDSFLAGFKEKISISAVKEYLQNRIFATNPQINTLRGKITFSSIKELGGVPFKTIIFMGMNESDYPKKGEKLDFNLIQSKRGDNIPIKRDEELYFFLDSILNAQKEVYISYIGIDDKTNEKFPPSSAITTLMAWMLQQLNIKSNEMLTVHKLHSFDKDYFLDSPNLFSYSYSAFAASSSAYSAQKSDFKFIDGSLKPNLDNQINVSVEKFIKFFENTAEYYLKNVIEMQYPNTENIISDDCELITPDSLEEYKINAKIMEMLISDYSEKEIYVYLKNHFILPVVGRGKVYFSRAYNEMKKFYEYTFDDLGSLKDMLRDNSELILEGGINLNKITINGKLVGIKTINGISHQTIWAISKNSSKNLFRATLKHLILSAFIESCPVKTYLFNKENNKLTTFSTMDREDAIGRLFELEKIFIDGFSKPIPFFLESSFNYAKKHDENSAKKLLIGSDQYPGELKKNIHAAQCFDENVISTDEFQHYATKIYELVTFENE